MLLAAAALGSEVVIGWGCGGEPDALLRDLDLRGTPQSTFLEPSEPAGWPLPN
jgi:hypothetical protein